MGSLCCCFRAPELDDESVESDDNVQIQASSGMINRNAQARFTLFVQNLTNKCEAVLGRRLMESMPSSYQDPSSSQPTIMTQSSLSGSSSSSSSSSGISLMRREKGSNHSRVEPEQVNLTLSEGSSKKCYPETPLMVDFDKVKVKSQVNIISEDDEDVCPICLEEYTSENPRIITKCSHHYHLSCIYEWNERSEVCPVCSKLMVFEEMT